MSNHLEMHGAGGFVEAITDGVGKGVFRDAGRGTGNAQGRDG